MNRIVRHSDAMATLTAASLGGIETAVHEWSDARSHDSGDDPPIRVGLEPPTSP